MTQGFEFIPRNATFNVEWGLVGNFGTNRVEGWKVRRKTINGALIYFALTKGYFVVDIKEM